MKKMFFLFIFLILIYSLSYAHALNLPLLGKIIYIDPGHGGLDPGAISNNICEKTINLEISLKLKNELELIGAKVYLTRSKDTDLSNKYDKHKKLSDLTKRANMINKSNADMYLSIHLNADKSPYMKGPQIFYTLKNKNNVHIAKLFQENLNKNLKSKRNIKLIKNRYLFKNINKPGILLELGFITNDFERNKLQTEEYQFKIVNILKDTLIEYFNCKI